MAQDTWVAPAVVASGTTWAQLKAGGVRAVLDNLASTNAQKATPTTQMTISETGGGTTGGLLEAGTCYVSYSWVDPFGETPAAGEAAQLTVVTAHKPRITIPSLPTGVLCANIYITDVGGASGTEYLYATGVTTTTFDLLYARKADRTSVAPTANSTGIDAATYSLLYGLLSPNSDFSLQQFSQRLSSYLSGDPVSDRAAYIRAVKQAGIAKAWQVAMAEIGVLQVANPGTLGWAAYGTMGRTSRTFS